MPDQSTPAGPVSDSIPTPQELEEILAGLDFFLHMDEADALPLEEDSEDGDEP